MKISLAPIPYFWSAQKIFDFYAKVAHWPVDIVYLGETICGKRRSVSLDDWLSTADQLQKAGKEVVLSTMALLEAESEIATLTRICANGVFPVEANDVGAVQLLTGSTDALVPFVIGPHINTYNTETISLLAKLGAKRWVMPVEIAKNTLADLQKTRPGNLETEVFVYGRLPLAFSARCFAARAHNLPKDQCDFCCGNYPDGLLLQTQEEQSIFSINGIQMQSAGPCNLLSNLGELANLGVDILRIVPQSQDSETVVRAFHQVLTDKTTLIEAQNSLPEPGPGGWCNGYWEGKAGMAWTGEDREN